MSDTVFGIYAKYYDLLYKDKDYTGEVDYITSTIKTHIPKATTVLELGCGTGIHASQLAAKGYTLHGVDISHSMLDAATKRAKSLEKSVASRLSFGQGDIRTYRSPNTFDVVVSLFHIVSYQITNADVAATFATFASHLWPGGLLVFDIWYAPAVLTQRPATRIKEFEDKDTKVIRLARAEEFPNQNRVDVHYDILVTDKTTKKTEITTEVHPMRYFSEPEIILWLDRFGFDLVEHETWLSGTEPGFDTWGTCFIAKKR